MKWIYISMKYIKLFEDFNEPNQFCEYCLEPVDIKMLSYPEKKSFIETGLCAKCLSLGNDKKKSGIVEVDFDTPDESDVLHGDGAYGITARELSDNALMELEKIVEDAMASPISEESWFKFYENFFRWEFKNNYYGNIQPFTFKVDSNVVNRKLVWKEYNPKKLARDPMLRIGVKIIKLRQKFAPIIEEHIPGVGYMNPDRSPNTPFQNRLNKLETSIKGNSGIIHNLSDEKRKEAYLDFMRNELKKTGIANRARLKIELESGEYFKNLTNRELDDLIDDAIDSRDFRMVDILRKIRYPED